MQWKVHLLSPLIFQGNQGYANGNILWHSSLSYSFKLIKKGKGKSKSDLHLAYLMIKSNFDEMRNIILLAKTLNAK